MRWSQQQHAALARILFRKRTGAQQTELAALRRAFLSRRRRWGLLEFEHLPECRDPLGRDCTPWHRLRKLA